MAQSRLLFVLAGVFLFASVPYAADIAVDVECNLADAIVAANRDAPYQGCPAGDGPDIITLSDNIALDANLPAIHSEITVDGAGFSISGRGRYRIFSVKSGEFTISNIELMHGNGEEGGGAISILEGATVVVHDSLMHDNWAIWGGAIWNDGTLAIFNSSLKNNKAVNGGGIYVSKGSRSNYGHLNIESSALVANSAGCSSGNDCGNSWGNGGAIDFGVGAGMKSLRISNTTVSQNSAPDGGGAISIWAIKSLEIVGSTIAHNSAGEGGGIELDEFGKDQSITISDSIIFGNKGGDCTGLRYGMVNNFIGDGSCFADFIGDPLLGEFIEPEDGSPAYYPLLEGSPAIGAASDEFCADTDQIGTPRPQGEGCDIGAIEFIGADD